MSAEPAKSLMAELSALAAAVELLDVRPMGFLARLVRENPPPGTVLAVDVKNQLSVRQEDEGRFVIYARFAMGAHPEGEPKGEFLKIRYDLIGRYRVPPEHPLGPEVLELFAKTNGMVHLWPYLRAFVANACAQMGVVPITLPPFRVPRAAKKPTKESVPADS